MELGLSTYSIAQHVKCDLARPWVRGALKKKPHSVVYDRKECGDGIGESLMVRMIVLWREFPKDAKDLGMLKPFFG